MFDKDKIKVKNKLSIDLLPPWRKPEITISGSAAEIASFLLGIAIVAGIATSEVHLVFNVSVAFTALRGVLSYEV